MNLKFKIKDKEYDISVMGLEATNQVKISINGKDFLFDMGESISKEEAPVVQASMPKRDFNNKEIRASLAGIISDIFVKEGDLVSLGQKVLTLSAMKMENEIVSEFEGKVKKIAAEKNHKVKEGDILIELY